MGKAIKQSPPTVFICYAREDEDFARNIYNELRAAEFDPWLDKENLQPGQNWRLEIPKALYSADFVLVLFSSAQLGKRGYVQKELKLALEALDETPEEEIRVIPARLEPCDVPTRFADLEWVDLFKPDGLNRILTVIRGASNFHTSTISIMDYFEVIFPTMLRWKGQVATEINKSVEFYVLTIGTWTAILKPPTTNVVRGTIDGPDLKLTITKNQMEKMLSGDFDAVAANTAGDFEISGDLKLLKVVGQLFMS